MICRDDVEHGRDVELTGFRLARDARAVAEGPSNHRQIVT